MPAKCSRLRSTLSDVVAQVESPATYACSLCAFTYGPLGQRAAWTRALSNLGIDSNFLHRDEMIQRHGPDRPPLPAVFLVEQGGRRC